MIEIISDTTAYLTKEFIKKNKIHIVPLKYFLNNKEKKEGIMPFKKFYQQLEESKEFPKTSQPSIDDFLKIYEEILSRGNKAIVFVLSSKISGTYDSAFSAKEQCRRPEDISLLDFQLVAQLTGNLIEEAAYLVKRYRNLETIENILIKSKEKLEGFFIPDNLEYLKKGGRINKISNFTGNLLNIKPLLVFKDGEIQVDSKIIGMKKTLKVFLEKIPDDFEKLYFVKIGNSKNFEIMEDFVKEKFSNNNIEYSELGPVLGSHIGKGIGLVWRNLGDEIDSRDIQN